MQACRPCLRTQQPLHSPPDEVALALRHLSRLQQQLAGLNEEEELRPAVQRLHGRTREASGASKPGPGVQDSPAPQPSPCTLLLPLQLPPCARVSHLALTCRTALPFLSVPGTTFTLYL